MENKTPEKKETIWSKGFIIILMSNILMQMAQQCMSTLLPKYVKTMGAASSLVGLVSGMFAIAAIAIRPFASPAFDVFRKKHLIMFSLGLMAIAITTYTLATDIRVILVGRVIQGFGLGTGVPLYLAYACTQLPDSVLGKGVSIFSLGQAFGQAIGPSVGLALSRKFGYINVFYICIGFLALSLIFLIIAPADEKPQGKSYRIRFDTIIAKEALPVACLSALIAMSYTCLNSFLAIYGGMLNIENVGLFFTVYAVSLFAVRPVLGGMVDKYGFLKVMVPCCVLFIATYVLLSRVTSIVGILIAAFLVACSYGVVTPANQAMVMKLVPKDKRGIGSNTLFLGTDVGQFAGPYVAGLVIDGFVAGGMVELKAYSNMFLVMTLPLVLTIICMLVIFRKKFTQK